MAVETSSFVVLGIIKLNKKTIFATLMAQESVIVQITYCFILKYEEIITLKCKG